MSVRRTSRSCSTNAPVFDGSTIAEIARQRAVPDVVCSS
jgi:hypothetical protein